MAVDSNKVRVTHVEIRRVQNGFVVMALDYVEHERHQYDAGYRENPVKASFVAKDEAEVTTVISNILTSAEMEWLPTADVPMLFLKHREAKAQQELERTQMQLKGMQQMAGTIPPCVAPPPLVAPTPPHFGRP